MPRPAPGDYPMTPEALALAQRVQTWKERTGRACPPWGVVCQMLLDLGWTPPPATPDCRGQKGGDLD